MLFKQLNLSKDVLKGIERMGYSQPSPIQEKTIPLLLNGQDIIGQAQTGTGKTLAFGSVLLSQLKNSPNVQALILSPTRELAMQIDEELCKIGYYTSLKVISVYGGSDIEKQIRTLKKGVDIVVGTPGRVMDLMKRKVLKLDSLRYIVLDEADEMLNMGFIDDIELILKKTPDDKQTVLFSATMPQDIKKIASFYMKDDYRHIQIKSHSLTSSSVKQYYFETRSHQKFETLCRILDSREMTHAIIFCRTKKCVDEVVSLMQQRHYSVEAMHGDLGQTQRMKTLKRFKNGMIQYLVATDVAARGIDVTHVTHVVNYEMPQEEELYIHRIGRTGRASKKGEAYSIVTQKELQFLKKIAKQTNTSIERCDVPSINEIFDIQIRELLFDVQSDLLKGIDQRFVDIVKDIPGSMRQDVLAALLKIVYQQRVGHSYELQSSTKYEELFMNCGTIDKISVVDVVNFIVDNAHVKKSEIGKIEIKRKTTVVQVKPQICDKIIKMCQNKKIKQRKIRIDYMLNN